MTVIAQPLAGRASLLRRALQVDAALVAVSAVSLVTGAPALGPLLGIPATALFVTGLVFVPYAAFLAYVATRPVLSRRAAWAVMIVNVVYVLDSIVLLVSGALSLTPAGFWFVVAQAVVVDLIAVAQYLGLRRA